MAKRGKKIVVEGNVLDIINTLPSNVITHILDLLPIHDLVRTSVLSRKWRYVWASHPNIKIDYLHSREIMKRKNVSTIMNKIIMQHIGPVLKFNFRVPPGDDFDHSCIDQWLLYLSRNGIKELTLGTSSKLSSHIFYAPELTVLNLGNIIFIPPNGNAYFRKLTILNFFNIKFELSKLTSAMNTPQLTNLTMMNCSGVCHFKICAPKLKTFSIEESSDVELNGFEMPEITTLAIAECALRKMSLTKLFEKWRLISWFYISGNSFESLVARTTHLERLPIMACCLRNLVIENLEFIDLRQISCMLCLLKSATTLSRLEISVQPFLGWEKPKESIEVSQYLDAPHNMNWTTNSIEVVVIDRIYDPEMEMGIIKFILSHTPKLKKMFVASECNEGDIIKLAKRLLRFPRASVESEIIFESNVRVASMPVDYYTMNMLC